MDSGLTLRQISSILSLSLSCTIEMYSQQSLVRVVLIGDDPTLNIELVHACESFVAT
jgi:hypothetical protein